MNPLRQFALALLCLTARSAPIFAQDTLIVKAGDRIRIAFTANPQKTTGEVLRVQHDSVFLRPCSGCLNQGIPQSSATGVEVRLGHGGHGILGAALGFLGGGALGAFVLAPCPHGNYGADGPPCGTGQVYTALAGAFFGLFVGGAIGNWLIPSERWLPARWP